MSFVQILATAIISGVVSALTVMTGVNLAHLPNVKLPQERTGEISLAEQLEPDNCDIPEECHLFKRGIPYMVMESKIRDGEMLVLVESMDNNIEPKLVLSRQPTLRDRKPGTVFMLVGTGDMKSSMLILYHGQESRLDV
jgi:hypothetical protein